MSDVNSSLESQTHSTTASFAINFTSPVIYSTNVTTPSHREATSPEILSPNYTAEPEVLLSSTTGATMTPEVVVSKSPQDYLEQLNQEFTDLVLPAIVYLGILMVIGIVGNSLVLYVYTYRAPTGTITRYIQALAVFDLLSCCVAMPGEIADMAQNFTFGKSPVCKAIRTVNLFCTMASGATLVVVAVDRYKRICCPLNPQISPRGANVIVLCCTSICLMLSLPSAAIFGSRTIPTPWEFVNGTDCSISDQFIDTALPLAYNNFQMLLFVVGAVILTVLYFFIARTIFRQARLRKVRARRSSMIQPMDGQTSPLPLSDRSSHPSMEPSSPEVNGTDHDSPLVNSNPKENNSVPKLSDGFNVQTNKAHPSSKQNGAVSDSNRFDSCKTNSLFVDVELSSNTTVSPPETPIDHQVFDWKPLIKSKSNNDRTTTKQNNSRQNGHHCSNIRGRYPMEQLDEMESTSTSSSCGGGDENDDDGKAPKTEGNDNNVQKDNKKLSLPTILVDISSGNNTTTPNTKPSVSSNVEACSGLQQIANQSSPELGLDVEPKTAPKNGCGTMMVRVKPQTTPGDADSGFGDGGSQEKLRWSLTMATSSASSANQKRVLFRSHSDVGADGNKGIKKAGLERMTSPKGVITSDDEQTIRGVVIGGPKDTLAVPRRERRRSSFKRFRPDLKRLTISDPHGTRRTTLMLNLITIIYILSFLPHLLLMIIKSTHPASLSGGGGPMEVAHNILLRSYFINSVANPIIYSFCSRDFFTHCVNPGKRRRGTNQRMR